MHSRSRPLPSISGFVQEHVRGDGQEGIPRQVQEHRIGIFLASAQPAVADNHLPGDIHRHLRQEHTELLGVHIHGDVRIQPVLGMRQPGLHIHNNQFIPGDEDDVRQGDIDACEGHERADRIIDVVFDPRPADGGHRRGHNGQHPVRARHRPVADGVLDGSGVHPVRGDRLREGCRQCGGDNHGVPHVHCTAVLHGGRVQRHLCRRDMGFPSALLLHQHHTRCILLWCDA